MFKPVVLAAALFVALPSSSVLADFQGNDVQSEQGVDSRGHGAMVQALKSFYVSKLAALKLFEIGSTTNHPLAADQVVKNHSAFQAAVKSYDTVHDQSVKMSVQQEEILMAEMQGINQSRDWDKQIQAELTRSNIKAGSYDAYLLASKALLQIRYAEVETGMSAIKRAQALRTLADQ